MPVVNFNARRSVAPGYVAGNPYSLDIPCQAINPSRKVVSDTQESLSGLRETLRYHAIEYYAVTTFPLAEDDWFAMKMFLDSVESGETFTFDPYGSSASAYSPFVAELEEGGYTQERVERGQGAEKDYFVVQFTVRVRLA